MINKNVPSEKCTGCYACFNACSTGAITMKEDELGFAKPIIDEGKCIDCSNCDKVCPVLNTQYDNNSVPLCYAVTADDEIREKSSSGGVFTILAKHIINQNGIVCGAMMNNNLEVEHICIDNLNDLSLLRKSKYIQSNIGNTYEKIKEFLAKEKLVLFTGCPCQVSGLKNYLGKGYDNLITVDLLCHGISSRKMLIESLAEEYNLKEINDISFRNKDKGWNYNSELKRWATSSQSLKFKVNGKDQYVDLNDSAFEIGFHQNVSLQECCFQCVFSTFPRQGDITLGDYWGIENYNRNLTDNKGISAVLINNQMGHKLFDLVKDEFVICEETPLSALCNRTSPTLDKHPARERFLSLYNNESKSFNASINYAVNNKYDIGIVGLWYVKNHGSQLTYYALYHVIKEMQLLPLLISQPFTSVWKPEQDYVQFKSRPYKEYEMAVYYYDRYAMKALNDKCDTFLLGSDQLWNIGVYDITGRYASMEWVLACKRKIAYAASFGHNKVLGNKYINAELAYYLEKFDAISVREKNAVVLAKEEYGLDVDWVLDPVFLCNKKYFDDLAEQGKDRIPNKKFLFAYILDPNSKKGSLITNVSNKYNLDFRIAIDGCDNIEEAKKSWTLDIMDEVYNEEWLAMIKNAEVVITDSYHGMCFAIIYHKPFIAIVNSKRGFDRFESLASLLNLNQYLVTDIDDLLNHEIEIPNIIYDNVDAILLHESEKSLTWLKKAIFSHDGNKKKLDTFDILDSRCSNIDIKFSQQFQEIHKMIEDIVNNSSNDSRIKEEKLRLIDEKLRFMEEKQNELIIEFEKKTEIEKEIINGRIQKLQDDISILNKEISASNKLGKFLKHIARKILTYLKIMKRRLQ